MTVASELLAYSADSVKSLVSAPYSLEQLRPLLRKERLSFEDFCALLSPSAESLIPEMAARSQALTLHHFGKAMQLYTPLYLSNACINQCLYCGFKASLKLDSIVLSDAEMIENYTFLAKLGFGHILLLTGEHPRIAGVDYIEHAIILAKQHFPSVSLEIFPGTVEDYARYAKAGANGVTLYQETYDPVLYQKLHPTGPKSNYASRLEGPDRALLGGIRQLGIGALLGLADWRQEGAYLGLHAALLQKKYWQAALQVSFPRIQPLQDAPHDIWAVPDKALVQLICCIRLYLPQIGLTLSTRESSALRNKLIHIGITHISAGSNTRPGGYTRENDDPGQFDTQDNRSLNEVMNMLKVEGFDPVLKDWSPLFDFTPNPD